MTPPTTTSSASTVSATATTDLDVATEPVTAAQLRALQQPLKERYRTNPATAVVPSQATARLEGPGIAATITTDAGPVVAGLHPVAGGSGAEACSADIFLQALAACAAVTLKSVATAMSVNLQAATVTANGTWDARGTLGIDRAVPVGLTSAELVFEIDTDAEPATIDKLIELTERYCVIAQTLVAPPQLRVRRA